MPAIWKDAAGELLELPGPGGGIVACGALPGAAAPVPAWTAGRAGGGGGGGGAGAGAGGDGAGAGVGVAARRCSDEALAGAPARRARKITPRLAMQVALARALMPGTAAAVLRALAQRPREADPGYDLPAASSLSDADAFLQVRPFLRLLAGLCGQVRPVPLPGVTARAARARHAGRGPGGGPAAAAGAAGRAVAGRPLARAAGAGQGRHRPRGRRPEGHRPQRRAAGSPATPRTSAGRPAPAPPPPRRSGWSRSPTCGPAAAWRGRPGRAAPGRPPSPRCLEPAYGPGDLDLADRGFPSREAVAAKITAGKHFAWRVSSAWKLRRCGPAAARRHLEGGDHLARPHRQGPRHRVPHGPGLRSAARPPAAGRPAARACPSASWTTVTALRAGCAGSPATARSAWRCPRPSPSSPA